jgi:hypothetical protein
MLVRFSVTLSKEKKKITPYLAECPPTFFHKSLFFVGEFGFNDYSFSLLGKTMPQVRSSVPDVVRSIAEATEV